MSPDVEFFRAIPLTRPDGAELDVSSGPAGAHLQVITPTTSLTVRLQVGELEGLRDAADTALLHQRLVVGAHS